MDWARLRTAAWISLSVHLAAGLAMAGLLSQGLETNPSLPDRWQFVGHRTGLWVAGWLTWHAAAISILYFIVCFRQVHRGEAGVPEMALRMAVLLGGIAVAADLIAQALEIGVLPGLARDAHQMPEAQYLFLIIHRGAVVLTGFLANALYTAATVVLAWVTRHRYPRWIWLCGLAVGAAGTGLSVAALADSAGGMFWANAFLVPAILAWQVGVALTAGRRAAHCARGEGPEWDRG